MKDEEVTDLIPIGEQQLDTGVPVLATQHPLGKVMVRHLLKPIPAAHKKTRPGPGGTSLTYVPWPVIARRLTEAFADTWSYTEQREPQRITLPPLPPRHDRECKGSRGAPCPTHPFREREEVMVAMRLTTPRGSYDAVGSSTYFPSNPDMLYGDVVQAAQSYALRRAAARLGPGLDLYMDTDEEKAKVATEVAEAKTSFASACRRYGITEQQAVPLLSKAIVGDATVLTKLQDCLDALDSGEEAYWKAIDLLGKIADEGNSKGV